MNVYLIFTATLAVLILILIAQKGQFSSTADPTPTPKSEKKMTTTKKQKFVIAPDTSGEFFWNCVGSGNNKVRCTAGESFASKRNAKRALLTFLKDLGVDLDNVDIELQDNPLD